MITFIRKFYIKYNKNEFIIKNYKGEVLFSITENDTKRGYLGHYIEKGMVFITIRELDGIKNYKFDGKNLVYIDEIIH